MKKTLFIGSVVLDMIVHTSRLPKLKEDMNTTGMKFSIGGCSYNACSIVEHFHLPVMSCSPIGHGQFAKILAALLEQKGIQPWVTIEDEDNGCCLCLVNADGERTFLCQHGAEYRFEREWLKDVRREELDYIYVCGLELEDINGNEILDYLEEMRVPVFFAPGARITHIQEDRMKRMLALRPIIHLNEEEIVSYMGCETVSRAARKLFDKTHQLVIVTCGERGVYYTDGHFSRLIGGVKSKVRDTIGAGDAHAGACIAGLKMQLPIEKILETANKIASKVISVEGSILSESEFNEIEI